MNWHPLDGNMIAADRYHDRPNFYHGDKCPNCKVGKLEWIASDADDATEEDGFLTCPVCHEDIDG